MAGCRPLGRAAIAMMNRLGMLVDVAHTSRDTDGAGGGGVPLADRLDPFLRQCAVRSFRAT